MKIYIDLDDTLVDFMRGIKDFNIKNAELTKQYLHLPKDQWPKDILLIDKGVIDAMNTPNFFKYLPPMKGCIDLWREAGKLGLPYVLTAWPKTATDKKRVADEKLHWVEWYLEGINEGVHPVNIRDRFICCAREDKIKYATSHTKIWDSKYTCTREVFSPNVLVDDLPANISAWEKSGGIGIQFKNSEQTIDDLKKVFNDQC